MLTSPNLKFKLVAPNQAQKEMTVNESLIRIDALLNNSVIAIADQNKKPPESGDLYIIDNNPVEIWQNKSQWLAYYYINSWYFIQPKIGITLWLQSEKKLYTYNGVSWAPSIE